MHKRKCRWSIKVQVKTKAGIKSKLRISIKKNNLRQQIAKCVKMSKKL